jgi:hypothetical protein
MTTLNPIEVRGGSDPQQQAPVPHDHLSRAERHEEEAVVAEAAVVGAGRGFETALIVLVGLLVCPPLAIATVLVVVPFLVTALVIGLLIAVISTPYLLVHHFRGHHGRGHFALLRQRLGHAWQAILDLAPHRIVRGVREAQPTR